MIWRRPRTLCAFAFGVALIGVGACSSQAADEKAPTAEGAGEAGVTSNATPDAATESVVVDAAFDALDARPTRVPMFIAQGKLGRTTVSCDDGKTWIADKSENSTARCWDDMAGENIECDHHSWSSVGMVDADGVVLATYGWGYPGMVRRTDDGIHWEDVLPGHTFAGMAFGNGHVVANDRNPWISSAAGSASSWAQVGSMTSTVGNVRRIGFVPDGGGRFVVSLESGTESDVQVSDDNGKTWHSSPTRPAECAKGVSGIVHGDGVTLLVQSNGSVCRSTDRGETWTHVPVTSSFASAPLYADGAFMVWEGSTRHRSTDGVTWASTPGTAGVWIGAVARAPNGTYVAVRDGWQQWYEKQLFYRSTDGVTWDTLPLTAFKPGHPITHMIAVSVKPSAECPLP